MNYRELGWENADWIHLSEDDNDWRAGCCEHGNEPSFSIKGREFLDVLDQPSGCYILKDSAPWSSLVMTKLSVSILVIETRNFQWAVFE
jgi:hypothetical protein